MQNNLKIANRSQLVEMLNERNIQLQFEIGKLSLNDLGLEELPEQEISTGVKAIDEISSIDETFNLKFQRLKTVLRLMNQKLVNNEINIDVYRDLYRKFARSIP